MAYHNMFVVFECIIYRTYAYTMLIMQRKLYEYVLSAPLTYFSYTHTHERIQQEISRRAIWVCVCARLPLDRSCAEDSL